MVEQKINEVSQVTKFGDTEYIIGLTEDGTTVRIKKYQLYPIASTQNNGLMTINQYLSVTGMEIGGKSDARVIKIAEVVNDQSIIIQINSHRTQARVPRLAYVSGNLYNGNIAYCAANNILGEPTPFYYKIENNRMYIFVLLHGWLTLRVLKIYGNGTLKIEESNLSVNDLVPIV